jgi:hypothetical protein
MKYKLTAIGMETEFEFKDEAITAARDLHAREECSVKVREVETGETVLFIGKWTGERVRRVGATI